MKLAHQNPVDGFAFQRKLDYSRMRRTETGIYVWKLQAQWQTHEGMSALLRTWLLQLRKLLLLISHRPSSCLCSSCRLSISQTMKFKKPIYQSQRTKFDSLCPGPGAMESVVVSVAIQSPTRPQPGHILNIKYYYCNQCKQHKILSTLQLIKKCTISTSVLLFVCPIFWRKLFSWKHDLFIWNWK